MDEWVDFWIPVSTTLTQPADMLIMRVRKSQRLHNRYLITRCSVCQSGIGNGGGGISVGVESVGRHLLLHLCWRNFCWCIVGRQQWECIQNKAKATPTPAHYFWLSHFSLLCFGVHMLVCLYVCWCKCVCVCTISGLIAMCNAFCWSFFRFLLLSFVILLYLLLLNFVRVVVVMRADNARALHAIRCCTKDLANQIQKL